MVIIPLILLLLSGVLYYWVYRKKYSHLPSPWLFLPGIGHIQMLTTLRNPNQRALKLYKKYSRNGFMLNSIVGLDVILCGDFDAIKYLFNHPSVQNRGHTDWRKDPIAAKLNLDLGNEKGPLTGLVMSQGKTWSEQRRFTLRTLRDFGFGKASMEEIISDEVKLFLQFLKENCCQGPVDPAGKFNLPVLNVLWRVACGEGYDYRDERLTNLITDIEELSQKVTSLSGVLAVTCPGLFRIFPNLFQRQLDIKVNQNIKALIMEKIKEHKETVDYEAPRDFIDAFLAEIEKTTDTESSFYGQTGLDNLCKGLMDLFVVGGETSSTTLTWAVLYMAREQEVQKRVQKELDLVVGQSSLPSVADRPNLPYTEAVILEILRCGNIVPRGIQHMSSEDLDVNGTIIPANTMIMPLMDVILKGDHWGDGTVFRPERFLDACGNLKKDEHLMPFSIGKRQCLGETMAKVELFLFFAGLVQQFDILPEKEGELPSEEPLHGITQLPVPFQILLRPRSLEEITRL